MSNPNYTEALGALDSLRTQVLSIIRLSEPISLPAPSDAPTRTSDASNATDGADNPSPASLAADLTHYKELFSKLRFSYLEQVTKEKFLRAIVGEPPQIVEHAENVELEGQLAKAKAELKAQKMEVQGMVEEIEVRGRDLSERYEAVTLQTRQLSTLPSEITSLQSIVSTLRTQQSAPTNPSLALPLPETQALLAQRQAELDQLNQQIKSLQQAIPRRTREAERLDGEVKPLEVQRAGTLAAANEARRRKEEGERGMGDELEMKGRWHRSVEAGLVDLLGAGA